jgi:hypothetical protein
MFIDGNRDLFGARFDHALMIEKLGKKDSCVKCHHMNMPMDSQSGCWECHRRMYAESNVFEHDWHASPTGGKIACDRCHAAGEERSRQTAKKCHDCHTDLYAGAAQAKDMAGEEPNYVAMSYVDAMHEQCIACHREMAADEEARIHMTACATCHGGAPSDYLTAAMQDYLPDPGVKPVMLPKAVFEQVEKPGN